VPSGILNLRKSDPEEEKEHAKKTQDMNKIKKQIKGLLEEA